MKIYKYLGTIVISIMLSSFATQAFADVTISSTTPTVVSSDATATQTPPPVTGSDGTVDNTVITSTPSIVFASSSVDASDTSSTTSIVPPVFGSDDTDNNPATSSIPSTPLNPLDLLSLSNFAILSQTGITDVPSSNITGNIGTSPITGAALLVTCPEVTGTIYSVDAAGPSCEVTDPTLLTTAVGDMGTAYTDAAGMTNPTATELGSGDISGLTIAPGLYKWSTDVNINTNVTLSGGANDVWIFQIAGDLNVASAGSVPAGVHVILSGGAQAGNIFWQVGGVTGATLGTYSTFNGTILSAKQIILQTGAVLNGRALAQTDVTLDTNTIVIPIPHWVAPVITSTSTPQIVTLSLNVTGGNASDTVTSVDNSINCDSSGSVNALCTLSTTTGTMVSLTANATGTDIFSGWSGDVCTNATTSSCIFALTATTSVIATFATTTATAVSSTNVVSSESNDSYSSGGYSSGGGSEYIPFAIPLATTTLGSALSCPLLTNYVIPGRFNNPSDISKIQVFFNVNDNANLTVNGVLDTATINAIKTFQGKYLSDIMGPWGATTPSGQAYITTIKKINAISCDTSLTLNAQELGIINAYKAQVALAQSKGTPAVATTTTATATTTDETANTNTVGSLLSIPQAEAAVSTPTSTDTSALVGNAISATGGNFFSGMWSAVTGWFK